MMIKKILNITVFVLFCLMGGMFSQSFAAGPYVFNQDPPAFNHPEKQIKYYQVMDSYKDKTHYYLFLNDKEIFKISSNSERSPLRFTGNPLIYWKGYLLYPVFSQDGKSVKKILVKNAKGNVVIYSSSQESKEFIAGYALSKNGRYLVVQLRRWHPKEESKYIVLDLKDKSQITQYSLEEGRSITRLFSFDDKAKGFYLKVRGAYHHSGPDNLFYCSLKKTKNKPSFIEIKEYPELTKYKAFYSSNKSMHELYKPNAKAITYNTVYTKKLKDGILIPNLGSPYWFAINKEKLYFMYPRSTNTYSLDTKNPKYDFVATYDLATDKFDIIPFKIDEDVNAKVLLNNKIYFWQNIRKIKVLDLKTKKISSGLNNSFNTNKTNVKMFKDSKHDLILLEYFDKGGAVRGTVLQKYDVNSNKLTKLCENSKMVAIDDNKIWYFSGGKFVSYSPDSGEEKECSVEFTKEGISLADIRIYDVISTPNYLFLLQNRGDGDLFLYDKRNNKLKYLKDPVKAWNIYKNEIINRKMANIPSSSSGLASLFYYAYKGHNLVKQQSIDKVYLMGDKFIVVNKGNISVENLITGTSKALKIPYFKAFFAQIIGKYNDSFIVLTKNTVLNKDNQSTTDFERKIGCIDLTNYTFKYFDELNDAISKDGSNLFYSDKTHQIYKNNLYVVSFLLGMSPDGAHLWKYDLTNGKIKQIQTRKEYDIAKFETQNGKLFLHMWPERNGKARKFLLSGDNLVRDGLAERFDVDPYQNPNKGPFYINKIVEGEQTFYLLDNGIFITK
ncbi:MAG: hypothetical protein HQ538_07190 [Parcubacteria group bacterium]|nr:hypothetical protein [Parcubacteria group bacterium]